MTSVLIVEDEPLIALNIRLALEKLNYEVWDSVDCAEDALAVLDQQQPSIILLDIRLEGKMDGISLAELIRLKWGTPFIFLTSHTDQGTLERAKPLQPVGYIPKPFQEAVLHTTIEMGLGRENTPATKAASPSGASPDHVFVKVDGSLKRLALDEIEHVEACDNYCLIHMDKGRLVVRSTLKELVAKLPTMQFIRCHRTYLVNLRKVEAIVGHTIKVRGASLPLGKRYKAEFFQRLEVI